MTQHHNFFESVNPLPFYSTIFSKKKYPSHANDFSVKKMIDAPFGQSPAV